MSVKYLEVKVAEAKRTNTPLYGMAADGYTKKSGAPTSYMIRLEGEKIWRRIMVYQISNVGSLFVKIKGEVLYIRNEFEIQELAEKNKQ